MCSSAVTTQCVGLPSKHNSLVAGGDTLERLDILANCDGAGLEAVLAVEAGHPVSAAAEAARQQWQQKQKQQWQQW
jgi:hypothetical protein